ncbi:MAG: UDP-glucose 4-epimerase GalE [Burkholderiaceae bacterium]|nr:UDP-glucose 4-epimerase GalE [Burkholderiaceae bacterium]
METQILVTGGTGYIGSHTVVELIQAGYDPIILDNFSNSKRSVLEQIKKLTGKEPKLIEGDIRNEKVLDRVFQENKIEAVINFAGRKAVGESQVNPLLYFSINVEGSIVLLRKMKEYGIKRFVFSSSATVYGDPGYDCFTESTPLSPINNYGESKWMVEEVLRRLVQAEPDWKVAILRYFNPVGAHESGLIGEDPSGIPANLMPFVSQVAVGKREKLRIFGNDYPTRDGTGARDYIHVVDLALGHIAALEALNKNDGLITVNLGTGNNTTVLELVHAFEKASDKQIPYEIVERRPGDVAAYYTDPTLAKTLLNWEAQRDINKMCEDTWRWQQMNPQGYPED